VDAAAKHLRLHQTLIGAGVLVIGLLLAAGALDIPSTAGYQGVGPNFLPWVVASALIVCGLTLVAHAVVGGWRNVEAPSGAARGDWIALAWVAAGILVNAALITTIGFVFACALCYSLAVRGLRWAEGKPTALAPDTLVDLGIGLAISLPVFWLFTRVLAINLPGLTGTGWL
jgi:putative tricarboxylic transport membrane protein